MSRANASAVSSPSVTTLRRRGVALADGVGGGSVVGGVGSSAAAAAAAIFLTTSATLRGTAASAQRSTASLHVAAQAGADVCVRRLSSVRRSLADCLLHASRHRLTQHDAS
jgi:hypothetical protein